MLKQQLALTRSFIESSRHLYGSLLQSLEMPDYKYTTLEDTKEVTPLEDGNVNINNNKLVYTVCQSRSH